MRGTARFNSGQFRITKAGPVYNVDYNGARKGHCLPTRHNVFRSLGGADFETTIGGKRQAFGRVIATNYNYAIVYECFRPRDDGFCDPLFINIVALSRNRELPEDVVEKMLPYIEDACVTKDDFERIPHESEFSR
jgi:hypothetical protein